MLRAWFAGDAGLRPYAARLDESAPRVTHLAAPPAPPARPPSGSWLAPRPVGDVSGAPGATADAGA